MEGQRISMKELPFLQVPALPFADTRHIIVQSCWLSLGKLGQYTVLCMYGHLWQVFSCVHEPVCLALIRLLNSHGSS